MIFFIIFVLSAVLIGVGTMLAPALPTEQPRIGLASSLTLMFIVTGGILWTQFVAWDTLVIDYLLFGSVSLVVLGGTMMQAQDTHDDDNPQPTEWLSWTDFLLLSGIGILCALSLLTPFFPQATEMITIQSNANITDLLSFGIKAHTVLSAYLSEQLRQDSLLVQQAIISVMTFLLIFTAYDLGTEIKSTQLGRIFALGALLILCALLIVLPTLSQFLISLLLHLMQVLFIVRYIKHRQLFDAFALAILVSIAFLL
ncbi:MAG: hypothetical protein AAF846_09320 [Chloroflexota bacterium]